MTEEDIYNIINDEVSAYTDNGHEEVYIDGKAAAAHRIFQYLQERLNRQTT